MLRILVVEDHAPMARSMVAALTAAGWIAEAVGELAAALDAARQSPIDLAVIDRSIRGESAFGIIDALQTRGLPCLLVSGHPRSTLPQQYRHLAFLEKPFAMRDLVAAVKTIANPSPG